MFSRGEERTLVEIIRAPVNYVVHVRESNGEERWMTVPSAIEAILRQADVERELTWGGWHLADFCCHTARPGTQGRIRAVRDESAQLAVAAASIAAGPVDAAVHTGAPIAGSY
jgi:hypothetical protein